MPRVCVNAEPDHRGGHFVFAITLLFFLGLVQFILLEVSSGTRDLLGYFSSLEHMGTFSRGIIDTRPMAFYLSMTAVMLTLTHQAFQSRKWRL